jgi:hypothetical protein
MDPNRPAAKAVFYVAPLARKGRLVGSRLEVLHDGEKVQEIGLPAKAATQRRAWIYLLLAILLPWFLSTHVQQTQEEFKASGALKGAWTHVVAPELEQNMPQIPAAWIDDLHLRGVTNAVEEFFGSWFPLTFDYFYRIVVGDQLFTNSGEYRAHLPFWTCVFFLVLMVLSWLTHREKKGRRVGEPLPAPVEE